MASVRKSVNWNLRWVRLSWIVTEGLVCFKILQLQSYSDEEYFTVEENAGIRENCEMIGGTVLRFKVCIYLQTNFSKEFNYRIWRTKFDDVHFFLLTAPWNAQEGQWARAGSAWAESSCLWTIHKDITPRRKDHRGKFLWGVLQFFADCRLKLSSHSMAKACIPHLF